mmetsp:Transcript_12890/g.30433  ORF Transcript_12890/g.30433 Transcript_12890/m.30433 type:complete len:220 (+) Transcript_12890:678-1337(+)
MRRVDFLHVFHGLFRRFLRGARSGHDEVEGLHPRAGSHGDREVTGDDRNLHVAHQGASPTLVQFGFRRMLRAEDLASIDGPGFVLLDGPAFSVVGAFGISREVVSPHGFTVESHIEILAGYVQERDLEVQRELPLYVVQALLEGIDDVLGQHGKLHRFRQVQAVALVRKDAQIHLSQKEEKRDGCRQKVDDPAARRLGPDIGAGLHEDVDVSKHRHGFS